MTVFGFCLVFVWFLFGFCLVFAVAETTFQGYVATGESCPVASCLQGNLNKAGGVFGSLLLLCWGNI